MKNEIIKALIKHAEGQIALHRANVMVYMTNPAGIGEHSDVLEAIQEELDKIAHHEDRIEVVKKHFTGLEIE